MNSSINNDVTLGGKQKITGKKLISNNGQVDTILNENNSQLVLQATNLDVGNVPSSGRKYAGITFTDINAQRIAKVEPSIASDGTHECALSASTYTGSEYKTVTLRVGIAPDGSKYSNFLRPSYSGLIGLGMTLGTAKAMPADGVLYVTCKVGSQSASLIQVFDGSGHAIAQFGHNGGTAEYNISTFTMIVARSQSINVTWNGAGNGALVASYLAPWGF